MQAEIGKAHLDGRICRNFLNICFLIAQLFVLRIGVLLGLNLKVTKTYAVHSQTQRKRSSHPFGCGRLESLL